MRPKRVARGRFAISNDMARAFRSRQAGALVSFLASITLSGMSLAVKNRIVTLQVHFTSRNGRNPCYLSGRSFLQDQLQILIESPRDHIDLLVTKLAENGSRPVIFKGHASIAVFTEKHANGCVEAG